MIVLKITLKYMDRNLSASTNNKDFFAYKI